MVNLAKNFVILSLVFLGAITQANASSSSLGGFDDDSSSLNRQASCRHQVFSTRNLVIGSLVLAATMTRATSLSNPFVNFLKGPQHDFSFPKNQTHNETLVKESVLQKDLELIGVEALKIVSPVLNAEIATFPLIGNDLVTIAKATEAAIETPGANISSVELAIVDAAFNVATSGLPARVKSFLELFLEFVGWKFMHHHQK